MIMFPYFIKTELDVNITGIFSIFMELFEVDVYL